MKSALQLSFASLVLSSALPGGSIRSRSFEQDDFVHVKDLRLYDSNGLHYLTGNRNPKPDLNNSDLSII
jgi:mannan endo-1,4-beta-mannosidase